MLLAALEKGLAYQGAPLLTLYTHNKGLADTLTSPPRLHSKLNQLGTIHRRIRQCLKSRISLHHAPSPGKSIFTVDWDPLRMGSFLAAHLALPVPDTPPAYFDLPPVSPPLPLADLFRSLSPASSWSWCQERTGHMILADLKPQVAHTRRIAALEKRDAARAERKEPPKWSNFTTIPYAATCMRMASSSLGRRGLCERILHEKHWTVGNNRAKGIIDPVLRAEAELCTLCGLRDSSDHWIRLCQHDGMAECRLDFNNNIQDWTDQVEPEARDLAKTLSNLSRGDDGYRVSTGNLTLPLFTNLLACPSIPPAALARATLKKFASLALGKMLQIWQIRSGLHGRSVPTPITLSTRKPWFYAIRVGRATGIFHTAADVAKHTHKCTGAQHKRFRSREEAQAYIDTPPPPTRTPWSQGQLTIYTDGSFLKSNHKAGWGYVIVTPVPEDAVPLPVQQIHSDYGRLCIDRTNAAYGGAEVHTNNTGELTALLEALRWVATQPQLADIIKTIRIVTDSRYVLNLTRSDWFPTRNRALVLSCQRVINTTTALYPTSLDWIKAHTSLSDADSFWNNEADRLANAGVHRVGTPLLLEPVPVVPALDSIDVASSMSCIPSNELSGTPSHNPSLTTCAAPPTTTVIPAVPYVSLCPVSPVPPLPSRYPSLTTVPTTSIPSPCDAQRPAQTDYG